MQLPYNFLNEIHHKCCLKSLISQEVLMITTSPFLLNYSGLPFGPHGSPGAIFVTHAAMWRVHAINLLSVARISHKLLPSVSIHCTFIYLPAKMHSDRDNARQDRIEKKLSMLNAVAQTNRFWTGKSMHLGQPRPFKMLMLQRQNPHLNISCCYQLTDKYEDVCKNFAEILGKMLGAVVPKHHLFKTYTSLLLDKYLKHW
jgi:hypothetical protein